jgi:hypothetical protein
LQFLLAALLGSLDIQMCDIGNAYLHAPNSKKVYAVAGKEFGDLCGHYVRIVRALYGLKSAGAPWQRQQQHVAQTLVNLGYTPHHADPDIWMKPMVETDELKYYEFVLVYVDDIICVSEDPAAFMAKLRTVYNSLFLNINCFFCCQSKMSSFKCFSF